MNLYMRVLLMLAGWFLILAVHGSLSWLGLVMIFIAACIGDEDDDDRPNDRYTRDSNGVDMHKWQK